MIDLAMIQKQGLFLAKMRGLAKGPLHSFEHLEKEIEEVRKEFVKGDIDKLAYELADVILVTLSIGEELNIDMEQVIKDKHNYNLRR